MLVSSFPSTHTDLSGFAPFTYSTCLIFSGKFQESDVVASKAVAKFRQKRGIPIVPGAVEIPYDMEDLLVSLSSLVELVKNYGKDIMDVAVQIFNTFWPGEDTPEGAPALFARLMECET